MVAMYGYNFCKASTMAIMLIMTNMLQVATVNVISRFVMMLGKLTVLASVVISSYMWLSYSDEFQGEGALFSVIPVLVVIALFAYTVASYVFAIYAVGVDTILLCFCQDCMIHDSCDTLLFNKGMHGKMVSITQAGGLKQRDEYEEGGEITPENFKYEDSKSNE